MIVNIATGRDVAPIMRQPRPCGVGPNCTRLRHGDLPRPRRPTGETGPGVAGGSLRVIPASACTISSSHGILNSATQDFRNNPNGYRPLYMAAQNKFHDAALHDSGLLGAGEQSTRELLARVLGVVGVKKVFVDFS